MPTAVCSAMCTCVPLCNWASVTPGTHTVLPDRRLLICRWNNSLENFYQRQKKKHKNSSFLLYMPHYTEIGNSLLGKIIICRTNLWYLWTEKFRSQFNRCCLCFRKLTTPATYHYAYRNKSHTQCKVCVCRCACNAPKLLSHQGFTLVLSVKLPASTEVASAMP